MLTLRRFKAMADSYGSDLQRWPEEVRAEASSLLDASPQARAVLVAERALDDAIAAASADETARLLQPDAQVAALARVRAAVGAQIAASAAPRRFGWRLAAGGQRMLRDLHLRWVGIAAAGGFAVLAGLLLGGMYASQPAPDVVLAMLQPAPFHILAD
jgi:hypothetical protein